MEKELDNPQAPNESEAQEPKEKRSHHKSDKSEIDARIQETLTLILSGMNTPKICHELSKRWNVHERTIARYVEKAREIIVEESKQTREAMLIEHRAHRRDLRNRARDAGDYQTELRTAQDEAKLIGLYPGDKSLTRFDEMSTDELLKLVSNLLGGNEVKSE